MYIVGNRSFNSYEQAAQYCADNDFDAKEMILFSDPLRYVVRNAIFETLETAKEYCDTLNIAADDNIKECREGMANELSKAYDEKIRIKALRAIQAANIKTDVLKVRLGKYCKDIYHLQAILSDAGFYTHINAGALWLDETVCSYFCMEYDSKSNHYIRLHG